MIATDLSNSFSVFFVHFCSHPHSMRFESEKFSKFSQRRTHKKVYNDGGRDREREWRVSDAVAVKHTHSLDTQTQFHSNRSHFDLSLRCNMLFSNDVIYCKTFAHILTYAHCTMHILTDTYIRIRIRKRTHFNEIRLHFGLC